MEALALIRSLSFLALVLSLIYLCLLLSKKRLASGLRRSPRVNLIEHKKIDSKLSLSLVAIDDVQVLLATTANAIAVIKMSEAQDADEPSGITI